MTPHPGAQASEVLQGYALQGKAAWQITADRDKHTSSSSSSSPSSSKWPPRSPSSSSSSSSSGPPSCACAAARLSITPRRFVNILLQMLASCCSWAGAAAVLRCRYPTVFTSGCKEHQQHDFVADHCTHNADHEVLPGHTVPECDNPACLLSRSDKGSA